MKADEEEIDGSYELHQDHLDDYWPVFGICTLVEIGALVVLDPEIFTLVACLKTIGLTGIWIGRKANGVFVRFLVEEQELYADRLSCRALFDEANEQDQALYL